jgi:uncharacterized protein YdeI (YjbR/CyaY-like superfamily)
MIKYSNETMKPIFFAKQSEFRDWLEKNYQNETELLVGFYKMRSGKQSMTWSQSVDEALCFGWIDGVRKSIDNDSYLIRFTQRRQNSIWSAVNIQKIATLTKAGLMKPAGLKIFENRKEDVSKIYSYENEEVKFSIELENQFKPNKSAWDYFQSLAPSYRRHATYWVMSAKNDATRLKRLNELIADSQVGTNKWKENKYNKK